VRNKRLPNGFGEAFLVWRCLDCGSLGSLDALPARCACGARREDLVYVLED
jgi:rubrerythrin